MAERTSALKSSSSWGSSGLSRPSSSSATSSQELHDPSAASRSVRWTSASKSISDSGSRHPARRSMASPTAPPTITAPAPNTAIPWIRRTGKDSLKPAIRLTPPSPTVSAARAESRTRRMVGGSDCMCLELPHRPRDDQSLDLVRAFVDLGDLGVAHHALDRILLDVSVSAEDLDGLDGHPHGDVRAEQLGHRRVLAQVGIAAIHLGARLIQELTRRRALGLHVGQ